MLDIKRIRANSDEVVKALESHAKKITEKKPIEKPKSEKIDIDEVKKALRESLSKLSSQDEKKEGEN